VDSKKEKPLAWLHSEVKTPPLSKAAQVEAGYLLRQLQQGVVLSMSIPGPCRILGSAVMN
jgi:hypothetical protein